MNRKFIIILRTTLYKHISQSKILCKIFSKVCSCISYDKSRILPVFGYVVFFSPFLSNALPTCLVVLSTLTRTGPVAKKTRFLSFPTVFPFPPPSPFSCNYHFARCHYRAGRLISYLELPHDEGVVRARGVQERCAGAFENSERRPRGRS